MLHQTIKKRKAATGKIGIEFRSFRIRRFHGELLETRANTKVKSTSDDTASKSSSLLLKPIAEPSQEPS
jgi:hypothetical protein